MEFSLILLVLGIASFAATTTDTITTTETKKVTAASVIETRAIVHYSKYGTNASYCKSFLFFFFAFIHFTCFDRKSFHKFLNCIKKNVCLQICSFSFLNKNTRKLYSKNFNLKLKLYDAH